MKTIKPILMAMACTTLFGWNATAATVNGSSASGAGFPVLSTDLLQTKIGSGNSSITHSLNLNGAENNAWSGPGPGAGTSPAATLGSLTDGVFSTGGGSHASAGSYVIQSGTLTYHLDTSTNYLGYNIEKIALYSGWLDNNRDEIKVTVSYSTVYNPSNFITIATVYQDGSGNLEQATMSESSSPFWLATGVKSIRFTFPDQEFGGSGYKEIDVIGIPSVAAPRAPRDLTAAGAIATLKADANSNPRYNETYNLGPTGLRGWIDLGARGGDEYGGADGTFTDASRQILVTVAEAPANAVLAVDDLILGAIAASSGTVPNFSSDCRKAFGAAITEAEQTGAGTLRVKRWRAGTITDVNIPITILGNYASTAPYTCPKSAAILANARNKLIAQVLADSNFFNTGSDFARPIHGLALLAGVAPGDANYSAIQTRLQTYARQLSSDGPLPQGLPIWGWAYSGLFLSEYYLSTNDAVVLPGIAAFVDKLIQSQSAYGTFGHGPARIRADGTGRLYSTGYGPVNSVAIAANMAIVMGKKALLAGGQTIASHVDPAIQRGADFFATYVNKGSIPYGEHEAYMGNHSSNGKDPMCAVFFGLQSGRAVETEYFTRMSLASVHAREDGHTGQGFSYLWGALGARVGGADAAAEYVRNIRWHLDLSRRTDGSFVYDGREGFGPGSTSDGTYLGSSSYFGLNPTASYILTYALPLQRLYITGKNANPANTLDSAKVAHATSAASFKLGMSALSNSQLISALSDYDPIVRHYAAIELGMSAPTASELATLRSMVTGTDANGRMGACQALGYVKDAASLPLLMDRTDKTVETNSWVRAKAVNAIREFPPATVSAYRDLLLARFVTNATDPNVIDWDDPIQISNGFLGFALFGDDVYGWQVNSGASLADYTINAPKNLLYPAIQTGLKQPDSKARLGPATFCDQKLPLADVQAIIPDFFELVQSDVQVDRMWGAVARTRGINILNKFKIAEGIPVLLSVLDVPEGFEWDAHNYIIPALNALESYGDAARWTLPTLQSYLDTWNPADTAYPAQSYPDLVGAIATIENAISAPNQNPGLPVADSRVVVTTGAKAITLTGSSPRSGVTFIDVTSPEHGTLTGTPPNLTYTPTANYSGPDSFRFRVIDSLGADHPSAQGTVSIVVGQSGIGVTGEYFDNMDFTSPKLNRVDPSIHFDWGAGSPDASVGSETFSARWSGLLLVPESGNYRFSTLNSDGVRLYVNGMLALDQFADQATNWNDSASIPLTKGQLVDLHLLYYENTGDAVAKLKWTGPSFAGPNGAIIGKEWLFSGAGVFFTPYAHSKSVSLVQNTPTAITLSGSGGSLTYTIVTPPTNGTLSGTPPHLTYTPSSNYNGIDSFTFRVNNGIADSAPATVSIGVSAGSPVGFTWWNAASGNMNLGANWTGGAAPATAGLATYQLHFNPSGSYTVTHNLSNGFKLNQMNASSGVTLTGTNSLAFTANGAVLPQLNQNGSSAVTVDAPVSLSAMTAVGGSGTGSVTLSKLVSGAGGLTKNGNGTLRIHFGNNTYSGGTILNAGQLALTLYESTAALGTGSVTLNGGLLSMDRINCANSLLVNGGGIYSDNGFGNTWSGPVTLNANLGVQGPSYGTMSFTGVISGVGGLTLNGPNPVNLSNTNTYTGPTSVSGCTLACSSSTALGTGPLSVQSGGKVALNYSGTRGVASLTLGGTSMPAGTYGSTSSTATNKNDTWFSGTGRIQVLTASTTTLALTGGSSPAAPGASLTIRATVTGTSPSGSVSFYDGATLLGSATLSAGQANFTTTTLPNGSRSITARYAGNSANAPSSSSPLVIVILPATPTIYPPSTSVLSVQLAWTPSPGATGYRVKRSLTSGGPYTLVANLVANQFVDTTVEATTQYYYVVTALSGVDEGSPSSSVSVVTPGNLSSVLGEQQFNPGNALPSPIAAMSGDLLQSRFVTATGENASSNLRNGTTGTSGANTSADPATIFGSNAVTYSFDLAASPLGYSIREIRLFSGWTDSRAGQSYQIAYSRVSDPNLFFSYGEVSALRSNGSLLTRTYDPSGANILTGVAALRFTMINDGNAGAGTLFREFDIIGSPATINPAPDYTAWKNSHGLTGGPDADDDGDGVTNRREYAFGLLPKNGASANPILVPLNKATGRFTYSRCDPALSQLQYTVWTSTDLLNWNQDMGAQQTSQSLVSFLEQVQVTLSPSLLSSPKLFVQVRATE